jgi:glycogen synthase
MRILLCSHWFFPSYGGVETVSRILAEEFVKAGASVTIVTKTPGANIDAPYQVVRRPSFDAVRKLGNQSDVIFQSLISLRTLVPLSLTRKPVVIAHHSWMRRPDGTKGTETYIKLLALRSCHNVSISRAVADALPVRSTLIGNPFDDTEFRDLRNMPKEKDIVFMGRLVSDKGVDLLLHALAALQTEGHTPSLTIIGDGPERPMLESLTTRMGLARQVTFLGSIQEGRGRIVAQHRIMAIPSLWDEPFGVVALEGIASGCALVASSGGGLGEAVGPCGLLFPNGDRLALTSALRRLLEEPALCHEFVANGTRHLQAFQPSYIAEKYMSLFRTVTSKSEHPSTRLDQGPGF